MQIDITSRVNASKYGSIQILPSLPSKIFTANDIDGDHTTREYIKPRFYPNMLLTFEPICIVQSIDRDHMKSE